VLAQTFRNARTDARISIKGVAKIRSNGFDVSRRRVAVDASTRRGVDASRRHTPSLACTFSCEIHVRRKTPWAAKLRTSWPDTGDGWTNERPTDRPTDPPTDRTT